MYNYYKNKNIEGVLKELNIDISSLYEIESEEIYLEFGSVIAAGHFSAIIDLDYLHTPKEIKEKFEDPVLILTTEPEKRELIEKIFSFNTSTLDFEEYNCYLQEQWLEDNNYSSIEEAEANEEDIELFDYMGEFDIQPLLEDMEQYNLNHFFMERLDSKNVVNEYAIDFTNDLIYELFPFTKKEAYHFEHLSFEKEDILSGVRKIWKQNRELPKEVVKEGVDIFEVVIRDMQKAASVLDGKIGLDIHENQFVKYNNEIFCIDPFVIL